jgi:uncharacterized protein YacL
MVIDIIVIIVLYLIYVNVYPGNLYPAFWIWDFVTPKEDNSILLLRSVLISITLFLIAYGTITLVYSLCKRIFTAIKSRDKLEFVLWGYIGLSILLFLHSVCSQQISLGVVLYLCSL